MEQIVSAVMDAVHRAGLVEVEVSARHVHLSQADVEVLFGPGARLEPKRPLSQPGQFLSEQRVTLVGPKGRKERVAVLGPARKATQVELSKSDCMELGVKAPVRESGDVAGSGAITIEGPCGTLELKEGVIIAHNHIHVTAPDSKLLDLKDKQRVSVAVMSERPVIFQDVIIRVSTEFSCKMHIDVDEANAAPVGSRLKVGVDLGTAYIVLVVLDEENNPVACEKQAAQVLRDGVVVDYTGALRIVRSLKEKLEARLGTELVNCAIAMPAGTESSVKTHQYVAEGAGLEVTNILDEPSAANAIYQIEDGVVVDIGGGTTGLAILKEGKVVQIEDEPTGGTHLTLVLSGNYHVSFEEAEAIKQDYKRHREILPVVRPVVEKMATIVSRYVDKAHTDTIYLCGGTCCLTGIEDIFQKVTGIRTIKPANPFLVTPTGIAMNCTLE